jgi:hypothetical protein
VGDDFSVNIHDLKGIPFALINIKIDNRQEEAVMKCFFQGFVRPNEEQEQFNGFVSFAIPELGINYRGMRVCQPAGASGIHRIE